MTADSLVFLNGRFQPQKEASITLHDAGFIWGATVTDLCRTFRHQPFRLADHIARFRQSCRLACVPLLPSDDELTRTAEQLVVHNAALRPPSGDLALVMFATPGTVGYYLGEPGGPGDGPPTLGMHTFPLPLSRYARLFREGARLIVPRVRHIPTVCVDPRIKQRSRLHWWLAEQEVHTTDPKASALLLNEQGFVTETAAANFLIVKNGIVLTPPSDSVLNGVSLQVVRELCSTFEIPCEERPLGLDDALSADEAMLASTSFCLVGVRSVDRVSLPWPGPVWKRLLEAWNRLVGLDVMGQILAAP